MEGVGGTALVGRAHEQQALRDVLAAARDGISGTLILRGETGIGKTALLNDVVDAASDLDVLRIEGVESEMSLGFAALHQLLHPLLDALSSLPTPQADALRAAFGMGDGVVADQFFVALATLTLLATAATRRGLVLVVDNAQWLDHESDSVLAFVARRLYADRIAFFVGLREPVERDLALQALPPLVVRGLESAAAIELMASVLDVGVDDDGRARVLADAQGNPLAIIELTRELQQSPPGSALLPQPLSLDRQLEGRFLRQVQELPPATQRLLLTAAADPTGDTALLWRAGRALDFDEDAAKEAEYADLVNFGSRVTFRHPLIREAIYHGATDSDRRQTHAALAEATDVERDPDRHAWHRAAATLVPDEDVAAELEAVAERARLQGGYASAAALLNRAAQLTPDATVRGLRFLQSAAADLTSGQLPRARETLQLSMPMLQDPFVSANARRLEAAIQFRLGTGTEAPTTMLRAATELHAYDPHLARETALEAMQLSVLFGKYASTRTIDIARAAETMPLPHGDAPTPSDLLLDGLATFFVAGGEVARPLLRRALDALIADPSARDFPRRLSFGMWAAFAAGDNDAMRMIGSEYVALGREGGALDHLPEALHYLGMLELRCGTLARAAQCFTEEGDLQAMQQVYASGNLGQMLVLAWRGDEAGTRAEARILAAMASERRLGWTDARVNAALATLELGLGNYRAATAAAAEGWQDDIALNMFTASDAIEAHARSGSPDIAHEYLTWLQNRAVGTNMPLELGLLARSRGLLADDATAEVDYQDAVNRLTESGGALHLARAQLVYGEWLRRQKRRRDAREQLRAALTGFNAMGADAFAERTRIELLATGETARKRVDDTRDDLTPQETQIATLAAAGATNPEIGAQLFISASTVEYHLRKVYRKLGISSRRALAGALAND
jgi:DNA-binding CsgD family transcriptional regulator